jgi:phosphate transport system substrate-binding protein
MNGPMKRFLYFSAAVLILGATLTACKKDDDRVTVTFDSTGGSEVPPQTVRQGEKAIRPEDPTRPGKVVLAWYGRSGDEWDFDADAVTVNTTLYARWAEAHTVTFHSDGGSEVPPQMVKKGGERALEPPAPIREEYRFDGWYYTDPMGAMYLRWDFDQEVSRNMDLHAGWIWEKEIAGIDGLSLENYPRVDGATSTRALNVMIAGRLLGIPCKWYPITSQEWSVIPEDDAGHPVAGYFDGRVVTSQTNGAFLNLIDGNTDIVLRSTTASPDEKAYAAAAGVTVIETPIALDAFVFIVNPKNPVRSLTVEQIRGIYAKQITNWSQVGGDEAAMDVFTRPRNSGSEEALKEWVMNGVEPADFPEINRIQFMGAVFPELSDHENGICYTFDNYKEMIARMSGEEVPKIAVNGVYPDKTTIANRTYPLTTEVYAIIRSDLDRHSTAYELYEWLQTDAAEPVLTECGFVPI